MSKQDRLSYIASRVCAKRVALTRLVNCDHITPAQMIRAKRRLLRA